MKKLIFTIAAICGFFNAQIAHATCDISSSFTDGQVLTAAQLNTLVTGAENCSNGILDGDNFTGNVNLYSGADFNIYSDAGATLVTSMDGATGDAVIYSNAAGASVAPLSFVWRSQSPAVSDTTSLTFKHNSDTTQDAITAQIGVQDTSVTHATRSNKFIFSTMNSGSSYDAFAVGPDSAGINSGKKFYLDGINLTGDTYMTESSANVIQFLTGGSLALQLSGNTAFIPNHATTASAANAYVDSATGEIRRSTSSIKYKTNVENIEVDSTKIYDLRPVSYDDKNELARDGQTVDGKTFNKRRYFGLIAEEVYHTIPNMVDLNSSTGEPENVYYDRLSVLLLAEVKKLKAANDDMKARLTAAGL